MYMKRHTVSVTTAAGGTATEYTSDIVNGRILAIQYVKTDFANGSTMTVTGETSGLAIWSESNVDASATRYPRVQVHSSAGAGLTYDGTRTVCEPVPIANERIKIVISAGGATKTGTFYITVG